MTLPLFSEIDRGHFQKQECLEDSTSCLIVSLTHSGQIPVSEKGVRIASHAKEGISFKEDCIHSLLLEVAISLLSFASLTLTKLLILNILHRSCKSTVVYNPQLGYT
jgi:hypothetical protein